MGPPPDPARLAVLARYGAAVAGLRWAALGSGGGFSGAAVWRGDDPAGRPALALKAWPAGGMTVDRLAATHALMGRAAHLPFVPAVVPTTDRATVVTEAGRAWDVTRWMPGLSDFHANPGEARLANAAAALAELHRAWMPPQPAFAPPPAVRRRLDVLADFDAAKPALARFTTSGHSRLDDALRRAADAVSRHAADATRSLLPWRNRPVSVQPCLCDVWHDHVLFSSDAVTGVIDFGAVKTDHVAVDLARLLGDLVGDDARFAAALDAYRAAGSRLDTPAAFVRLLDCTGAVCAAAVWLLRLVVQGQRPADPAAVAARLARLADRLDAWPARALATPPFTP